MPTIIESRALTKRFGRVEALRGVDLDVEAGGVTALLGPNGAGKTTFVRAVATLVRPDGGTLRVGGHDVVTEAREVRRCIGLAGQHASVEAAMTGRENLRMIARLYGQDRPTARDNADRVLGQLDLLDAADRLVRTYSGGMRRRLDLGASLVGTPRLLLLDEPTTGLDPRSRLELWDTIRGLADRGTDVLLTTQYLDEADHLAGRVVIIDRGRVIADGAGRPRRDRGPRPRPRVVGCGRACPAPRRRCRAEARLGDAHGVHRRRRSGPADAGRAQPRRRRRGDRGHRPAPPDARRGVPRPDRPHCSRQ